MMAINSWDAEIVETNDNFGDDAADILPMAWQHHRHHRGGVSIVPGSPGRVDHQDKIRKGSTGASIHGGSDQIHHMLKTDSAVIGVSISPGGRHIGIGALAQTTVKPLSRFAIPGTPAQTQKKRKVTAVDLGSRVMATGHADGCIMIHDAKGNFLSQCSKNPGKILSCTISPDSTMVAYGGGGYDGNNKRGWFRIMDTVKGTLVYAMKAGNGRSEDWT